jgi:hypothetical protein
MPANYTMLYDVRLLWPIRGQYKRYCWGVYFRDDPLTILSHHRTKAEAARRAAQLAAPYKRA